MHTQLQKMPPALIEALSPRSANLPMNPPNAVKNIKKTKNDAQTKAAPPAINPDKIDEKWRPASMVKEPGSDGDAYLTGKKLGRGGFAVCFEGRSERTRDVFALKVVKSHVEQKKQLEKVRSYLQLEQVVADRHQSFKLNCRSMRRCTTLALLNSIVLSLSTTIPTWFSNYVPTVRSWIWSRTEGHSACRKFVDT